MQLKSKSCVRGKEGAEHLTFQIGRQASRKKAAAAAAAVVGVMQQTEENGSSWLGNGIRQPKRVEKWADRARLPF